jgi:hypothetical protein
MGCSIRGGQVDGEKVRENRLRRMAERQGLQLTKSRRRDPRAVDYGVYWLADAHTSLVHAGPYQGGFRDLDEVERFLTDDDREPVGSAS